MANEGTEALARAAGMGLAVPNVGSNADVRDVKNLAPSSRGGRVPFTEVAPDAATSAIFGTPRPEATALLVQISPGEHGTDLVRSRGKRQSKIPYALFDTDTPFTTLDGDRQFTVRNPYRE